MKLYLVAVLVLLSMSIRAQDTNPRIGSEKGVKEKLIRIKNGLPDIKKNLTKKDEDGDINVKFEMGNGMILFEEDEEDHEQSLTIRYTYSYYSGTKADYQNYYKTLVGLVKEVFGAGYDSKSDEKDKIWTTSFFEKDKGYNSPVRIYVKCSWVLDLLDITITIYSKVK